MATQKYTSFTLDITVKHGTANNSIYANGLTFQANNLATALKMAMKEQKRLEKKHKVKEEDTPYYMFNNFCSFDNVTAYNGEWNYKVERIEVYKVEQALRVLEEYK